MLSQSHDLSFNQKSLKERLNFHIDWLLLFLLGVLTVVGFLVLYSVSHQDTSIVIKQAWHIGLAFIIMALLAQVPPDVYQRIGVPLYIIGVLLLVIVLIAGHVGLGAQRWIRLGPINFQPSEILKIAIPMVLAQWYSDVHLPIHRKVVAISLGVIAIPAILTLKQPDMGTAIILAISGFSTIFLAGIRIRNLIIALLILILLAPLLWHFMHSYQQQRLLTFIHPERDPLGAGYHIIQSKIAIGSGGFSGLGFLHASQANLGFLPEHTTDFIFAGFVQQFGFIGALLLIILYLLITVRCFMISRSAQTTYTRLLAGSLSITFFFSFFINIAMVCGLMPVVGLPLPLVSYGGTAMVTSLANFAILMSIYKHRKLINT